MAKKNSSKTATEKAIQSSEPRVITYRGWQGVNFADAPLTWQPLENFHSKHDAFNETDLPDNFFMVQNNLETTDNLGVETRMDSEVLGTAPSGHTFTGVACMYKRWLFCAAKRVDEGTGKWFERILYQDINASQPWTYLDLKIGDKVTNPDTPFGSDQLLSCEVCEIGFFEGNIVATVYDHRSGQNTGILMLAKVNVSEDGSTISINGMNWNTREETLSNKIVDTPKICPESNRPTVKPRIVGRGMAYWNPDSHPGENPPDNAPVRIEVKYCFTNRLGSTLTHQDTNCATSYVELSPALWTAKKYVTITPIKNGDSFIGETEDVTSVTGIDFYGRDMENLDWVFIGHINITPDQARNGTWRYNWYGNMTDITQWLTAQLMTPTDNTTHGPDATHFDSHDSRMYFWGMPSKPYRLWVGGNPGSEFSVARGLGGAWVDIEPGSGYDIKGTAKWKTVSGANIVTIMCGNQNTTKIKRFNLVETNLTLSNEVAYKSYMYEEVSNVVGCNSRWGYGVFADGLYSLNRYGLMLTTMAMEYNSQMKNQKISEVIEPIFTNILGKQLRDGRLVWINDIIYIAFSEEDGHLGNVILCYDTGLKAWYTMTHDQTLNREYQQDQDKILHIFAVDSDEHVEGLGAITETEVRLYPVTGEQSATVPAFQVLLETGELAPRMPQQAYWFFQQLELRFDYFISNPNDPPTVLVEGVDYYGRFFQIEKKLNYKQRSWQDVNDNSETGERRNHIEWIRIDKLVQSVRIRIKGKARFRLTHINAKVYQQADTIGTPYGYDAKDMYYTYRNQKRGGQKIHHYIEDYNNLRRAVVS